MSILLVAKKLIRSPTFTCRRVPLLLSRSSSSSTSQIPDREKTPFLVNDYLASTFGFSPAKAAAISKPIAHLKSPLNPDAVFSFLNAQGFNESQIKTIVTRYPKILCSSLDNTLVPNLHSLRNMGLSTSALTHIILSGPQTLQCREAVPRIMFWRDFVGGHEAALVRAFSNNRGLITHDIRGGIATKISLLQSRGLSTDDIRWIVCTVRRFIISSVSLMEDLLKRVEELGFQPASKMFVYGLLAMGSATREAVQKKLELLKSLGWSEDEFLIAVRKAPTMICLSEENLQAKMEFFLGETSFDASYITSHPVLLSLSLEKRLKPRLRVLRLLESKGLLGRKRDFYSAVTPSDTDFVAKYILPYKEEIPELHEVYVAACASLPK